MSIYGATVVETYYRSVDGLRYLLIDAMVLEQGNTKISRRWARGGVSRTRDVRREGRSSLARRRPTTPLKPPAGHATPKASLLDRQSAPVRAGHVHHLLPFPPHVGAARRTLLLPSLCLLELQDG